MELLPFESKIGKQFREVVKGNNFMTPRLLGYINTKKGICEITTGNKFLDLEMFGITVVTNNVNNHELSKSLNSMKEVVDFFKDTPSLAQIRGDEQYLTEEFDEEGYKKAIADYVVNSEFQSILGRNSSSDYYQNALAEGSISLNDIHDAIVDGKSSSEDTVNEIFNRLFGRSASSSYWADALEDGLVSLSNLESSILAGASEKDLAYYNANTGKVEITNWGDFEAAAKIAGIDEEDYYKDVTKTMSGDFSTSEKEVIEALDQLEALPDVIDSSGNLISTALDEFIDDVLNSEEERPDV